jgi:hypothetical protein
VCQCRGSSRSRSSPPRARLDSNLHDHHSRSAQQQPQQRIHEVHTYRDGMLRMGVLAPLAQLGLWRSSVERRWRLGFHVMACRCMSPLAPPLIFIEHDNGLPCCRPISTLIRIVMIASWAYHQQSPTCTKDSHIGKRFNVLNPLSV